jgi:Ni/Fe-hydrogenase subunit HybB-like protein
MRFVVIGILLALLAGTIYVSHYGWVSAGDVTMPAWGWLMMGLGIFFTVVVGGGLMILIFYSSRAGYDEPPHIEYDESETPKGARRRHKRRRNKVT